MSTIRRRVQFGSRTEAVLVALGFTAAGSFVGLIGAVAFPALIGAVVPTVTDAVYVVSSRGVQVGFGAFALGYIHYTDTLERYARFRRPTPRDAAALLAAFVALLAVSGAIDLLVSALGLPNESVTGTGGRELALETQPLLWPVVVVAWFGFATPAEELFYRGLVQTRLRAAFGPAAVVVLAAGCFALSHASFSALSGAGGAAIAATAIRIFGGGLVFCALYEATDNLVPVAVFHALVWLHPIHVVEDVLAAVL